MTALVASLAGGDGQHRVRQCCGKRLGYGRRPSVLVLVVTARQERCVDLKRSNRRIAFDRSPGIRRQGPGEQTPTATNLHFPGIEEIDTKKSVFDLFW